MGKQRLSKKRKNSTKSKIKRPFKKTSKRKAKIPKAVRDSVWNYYIGVTKGIDKCICCKNHQIAQNNFECGHVVSEAKGGKVTISNLRPICSLCNRSMGTKNMLSFMRDHGYDLNVHFHGRKEMLTKTYPNGYYFCEKCGYIKKAGTNWYNFWGEK